MSDNEEVSTNSGEADIEEGPPGWTPESTKFMTSYVDSCQALGLDPVDPRPFPDHPFKFKPHQVTGIYTALVREDDLLRFHIQGDESGLGKICQLLFVIHYGRKLFDRKEPTLVLGSLPTCLRWLDDASTMFPVGKGPVVVTVHPKPMSSSACNFTTSEQLTDYWEQPRPVKIASKSLVVIATHRHWIDMSTNFNKDRRCQRLVAEKISFEGRSSNFVAGDYDEVWVIPFERIIIHDGKRVKDPTTETNAALCSLSSGTNWWFVSSNAFENAGNDILGIAMLMERHLRSTLPKLSQSSQLRNGHTLDWYVDANYEWRSRVKSADDARIYDDSKEIPDWQLGYLCVERYDLDLLHPNVLRNVLTDKGNMDCNGHLTDKAMEEVIDFFARMVMIRRTKDDLEIVPLAKPRHKLVFASDEAEESEVVVGEHSVLMRELARGGTISEIAHRRAKRSGTDASHGEQSGKKQKT